MKNNVWKLEIMLNQELSFWHPEVLYRSDLECRRGITRNDLKKDEHRLEIFYIAYYHMKDY